MTDQERPPEPGGEPDGEPTPEPEQPTVGWTVPTQPGDPPIPPGAVPPVPPTAGVPPPPPIDPPLPAAGSGWSDPTPPASPAPPVPAGGEWSQPASAPGASGPLLSATPSAPSPGGWTSQPTSGQREVAPGLVFSSTVSRLAAYIVDGVLLAIVAGIVTSPLNPPQPITSTGQINVTTGTLAGDAHLARDQCRVLHRVLVRRTPRDPRPDALQDPGRQRVRRQAAIDESSRRSGGSGLDSSSTYSRSPRPRSQPPERCRRSGR